VSVTTKLNISAPDDGEFFGKLLSDYIAGGRVGIVLNSKDPALGRALDPGPFLNMHAKLLLPKLPPLQLPLDDVITELRRQTYHLMRAAGNRQLSLTEIWASLDPIIWSVTQPITAKLTSIQLLNFMSPTIDPFDPASTSLTCMLLSNVLISMSNTFVIDLEMPELSLGVVTATAQEAVKSPGPKPWSYAVLLPFAYHSEYANSSTNMVRLTLTNTSSALDVVERLMFARTNTTFTLVGTASQDRRLISRLTQYLVVQMTLGFNDSRDGSNTRAPPRSSMEKLRLDARVTTSSTMLTVDASALVPPSANPLLFAVKMGAVRLSMIHDEQEVAQIMMDPFAIDHLSVGRAAVRINMGMAGVATCANAFRKLQNKRDVRLELRGSIRDEYYSGVVNTTLLIPGDALSKFDVWDGSGAIRLDAETFARGNSFFQLLNLGVIGGDTVGSTVKLPCVLKGWCDRPASDLAPIPIKLLAQLVFDLESLVPDIVEATVSLPAVTLALNVTNTSSLLGYATLQPLTASTSPDKPLDAHLDVSVVDIPGLQATAFKLFEKDLEVGLRVSGNDVLSRLLALVPFAVTLKAPAKPVTTLRTLPTVCDKTWTLLATDKSSMTASVKLPPLSLPIPLTLEDMEATIFYKGVPILRAYPPDGRLSIGPNGGPPVAQRRDAGGSDGHRGRDLLVQVGAPGALPAWGGAGQDPGVWGRRGDAGRRGRELQEPTGGGSEGQDVGQPVRSEVPTAAGAAPRQGGAAHVHEPRGDGLRHGDPGGRHGQEQPPGVEGGERGDEDAAHQHVRLPDRHPAHAHELVLQGPGRRAERGPQAHPGLAPLRAHVGLQPPLAC
jgi:hypothetical protein